MSVHELLKYYNNINTTIFIITMLETSVHELLKYYNDINTTISISNPQSGRQS